MQQYLNLMRGEKVNREKRGIAGSLRRTECMQGLAWGYGGEVKKKVQRKVFQRGSSSIFTYLNKKHMQGVEHSDVIELEN